MRDFRTVNNIAGQKIEADSVLKRIGDLFYRDLGVFTKTFLKHNEKGLIFGNGFKVEASSNMTVNVPAGALIQKQDDDIFTCLQMSDQLVTLEAADGFARTDIIEMQIKSISSARDINYYVAVQAKKDTTTSTPATAAIVTGTVAIATTIDLSTKYLLNIADGEDGSFQEIDCRGEVPAATTKTEIIDAINTAIGRTMASNFGNYMVLTGQGYGLPSRFALKSPESNSELDAFRTIFGISAIGQYHYIYTGTNAWIKISEINVGAATTEITSDLIRNIEKRASWVSEADEIIEYNHFVYYDKNPIVFISNQILQKNSKNYANGTTRFEGTLPANAEIGDFIIIEDISGSGWKVLANSGQTIMPDDVASLDSETDYASIELECIEKDTTWLIKNLQDG